jgi:hypothetical protein
MVYQELPSDPKEQMVCSIQKNIWFIDNYESESTYLSHPRVGELPSDLNQLMNLEAISRIRNDISRGILTKGLIQIQTIKSTNQSKIGVKN